MIVTEGFSNYLEGWFLAKEDWHDLIPYDPYFWPDHVSDKEAEDFLQGYYDFWKDKDFSL